MTIFEQISDEIIQYSEKKLQESSFFLGLKKGNISREQLQYVFLQYAHWRNQFHRWFGLCILKSGSAKDPFAADAVLELAEHTVAEMKDDHTGMYCDFLKHIGIPEREINNVPKGKCTVAYEKSFEDKFGYQTDNFMEALASLSARELFASIRNKHVTKWLEENYQIPAARWWELHEELEMEHFEHTILPIVKKGVDSKALTVLMREEIDRHAEYWDTLLTEAENAS